MVELGVNIDHIATLRQARRTYEPDPVWAGVEAQLGGADGITMHLREDRRHIQDHDIQRIRDTCHVKVNLEIAATEEMVTIATTLRPHLVMLVPEGRQEITTEGGLDVAGQIPKLTDIIARLHDAQLSTSAFIDPDPAQVAAAAEVGFRVCEVHTGPYAAVFHKSGGDRHHPGTVAELSKITDTGQRITAAGMKFNAGHALNYVNVQPIAQLPGVSELHIGHAIVSRAVFTGLRKAVSEMKRLMSQASSR